MSLYFISTHANKVDTKQFVQFLIEKEYANYQKKLLNFFTCDFITINFVFREASLVFLKEYELFSKQELSKVFTENSISKFSNNQGKDKTLWEKFGLTTVNVVVNFCGVVNKTKKETGYVATHHQLLFPGI